ncbi:TetR/AcrR family transcriptional regulator [Pseudoteredinibacter isoporae]|uniref:TetR/AcrR family transcriptional regulator n=1 Tax=Pseudoteredinibacter isoporae TaxID=570281 RepID=UPI003109235E
MQDLNETAHKVLDVAERYTQTRGFNAFSYKDLQREVGVKTSSIHYYFPTKQDLAFSMTERYIEHFRCRLDDIAQQRSQGIARLEALGQLYVSVVKEGKFCMCGMLASDMLALPDEVNDKLVEFFQLMENWVTVSIELGKEQGHIKDTINCRPAAAHFLAALEGGMLIARSKKRPEYFEDIISEALMQMKG